MKKKKAAKKPLKKKPVKKPARKPVKKPLKKAPKPKALMAMGTHPPKTCPKATCQYYPCYWDALLGSYRCPRCGNLFQ